LLRHCKKCGLGGDKEKIEMKAQTYLGENGGGIWGEGLVGYCGKRNLKEKGNIFKLGDEDVQNRGEKQEKRKKKEEQSVKSTGSQ